MDPLDTSLAITVQLFELMGYSVSESHHSKHPELDIFIIHVTLDKTLSSTILEELTLASQNLVRSMTTQKLKLIEDEFTVSLDINDYLSSLIKDLKLKAKLYADRAMTFGVPVRMDPLPAFHRKIVHTFLQNTPGIHTESFGIGRDRHIVITIDNQ